MIKPLRLFCLVALLCIGNQLIAQQVTNIEARKLNDQIVRVTYDLIGELPGQLFTITLYSSVNDFKLPLQYVEGDVGEDVETGRNRFIDWDISKELVAFDGDLTFEVRAVLVFSPVKLNYPVSGSLRRGSTQTITWLGGSGDQFVDIELLRNDRKIRTIARTRSDGVHEWTVPPTLKPGPGYSIKVSSTSSTQSDRGGYFSIKRRVPLLVKLIPLAAIVPAAILLLDDDGTSGPRILPEPPDPPD